MSTVRQSFTRVADHFEQYHVYQGKYTDRGVDTGSWERLDATIPRHELEAAATVGATARSSVESYGVGPERFMTVTYICSVDNVAEFFRQIGLLPSGG